MKKSIMIFLTVAVFSVGAIVWGWSFVNNQVGGATLTEETIEGSRTAADWLTVEFRTDSADDLHWKNSFDYSTDQTTSIFKRGEMAKKTDSAIYDDIRFNGWSEVPYTTQIQYGALSGLQEQKIQKYYETIEQKVVKSGVSVQGEIRLKDYLDYYPISFQFQFGDKRYDLESTLHDLKIYEENEKLSPDQGTAYDAEITLYTELNRRFRIPVIDNEYQKYEVSKVENYDAEKSLGYKVGIEKPLDSGKDYYQFDPVIVLQEENTIDGMQWVHPDLSDSPSHETKSAYAVKNRMLFIVNNRTAGGETVDVSNMQDGYGIYELPLELSKSKSGRKGGYVKAATYSRPFVSKLKNVYPLDAEAEYIEMSLSEDHRYLAVFSVKDGAYFVDVADADRWFSKGPEKVFPASEKMSYAWGEDGSLVMTNHQGYLAVISKTDADENPYEILFSKNVGDEFVQAFFDGEMMEKVHSASRYQCGVEQGLSVAENGGKAALVQNLLVGDDRCHIRNAALTCAVIGGEGILYRGNIKSNLVDLDYDMTREEIEAVKDFLNAAAEREANALEKSKPGTRFSAYVLRPAKNFLIASAKGELGPHFAKYMIEPVRNENHARWR